MDTQLHPFIRKRPFENELVFKSTLSGGPGGQHVNKTESRIELYFNIYNSKLLNPDEKDRIRKMLSSRITKEDVLLLSSDRYRSQYQNKSDVLNKFFELLESALKISKKRMKTKPTKVSVEKRLNEKKLKSGKKQLRGRISF